MPPRPRPVGSVTRGTTNPNRLRRCDRWLAGPQGWRLRAPADPPVVVDLGYGASPVTVIELHERLRQVRRDVRVVGVEIDPQRAAAAARLHRPGLEFVLGGFEVPVPAWDAAAGRRLPSTDVPVTVIRAFNVLRQYDETAVPAAWDRMLDRLAPDGILVDGTCDELGRVAAWVCLDPSGPVSLTLSLRLAGLAQPSVVAERLPKALIHRNVPGERVHAALAALDRAFAHAAGHAAYGVVPRWLETVRLLREADWPVLDGPARWRLGEVSLAWECVAP